VVPSGTLSFLFTDLADSTLLWEQREPEMATAVARHDSILSEEVERQGGRVVKSRGDGLMAVFADADADAAVRAAVEGLRALGGVDWSVPLGVRMGVCTGPAREADGDYHGPVVNRAARIADAAHPGQILVAPATAVFVEAFAVRDLGEFHLKGLPPMRLWQVLAEGLESRFPPLAATALGPRCGPIHGVRGPGERARRHRAAGVGASLGHADRHWGVRKDAPGPGGGPVDGRPIPRRRALRRPGGGHRPGRRR
jgi:class 3 adenylate cyclase